MEQADKDLLLKDLCARLPYGVKISIPELWVSEKKIEVLNEIFKGDDGLYRVNDNGMLIEHIKPYLFPLSSMTVEHMCKVQNLLPNNCDISFKNQKITFFDEGNIQLEQLEKVFNFFNLYHYDYRGLISKGLANDAIGKNIY